MKTNKIFKKNLKRTVLIILSLICIISQQPPLGSFEPPEYGKIEQLEGRELFIYWNDEVKSQAKIGQELRNFLDTLVVKGDRQSLVRLSLLNSNRQRINNTQRTLFQAGPDRTDIYYSLSCHISNPAQIIMAFWPGNSPCKSGVRISKYKEIASLVSSKTKINNILASKELAKPIQNGSTLAYCGALSRKTQQWSLSYTQQLDLDVCKQAQAQCSTISGDNDCDPVSAGKWDFNDSQLAVTMHCNSGMLPFTRVGNAETIFKEWLPLMEYRATEIAKASECIVQIYEKTDIVVSANSDDITLFEIKQLNNNELAINALAGDLRVISADKGQGFLIPQGTGYRSNRDRLTQLDCPTIYQSKLFKDFFLASNWNSSNNSPEEQRIISQQLKNYQNKFCQTSPPKDKEPVFLPLPPIIRTPRPPQQSPYPGRRGYLIDSSLSLSQ